MYRKTNYPRSMYRTAHKPREGFYECRGCGAKFHGSNPLLVHIRDCRLYAFKKKEEK